MSVSFLTWQWSAVWLRWLGNDNSGPWAGLALGSVDAGGARSGHDHKWGGDTGNQGFQ